MSLTFHYNGDNSYLFINWKEIFKFKAKNKNVNFLIQFCLKWIFNRFGATESREVFFIFIFINDFSVDYNKTEKTDILNIPKYLIVKNNTK